MVHSKLLRAAALTLSLAVIPSALCGTEPVATARKLEPLATAQEISAAESAYKSARSAYLNKRAAFLKNAASADVISGKSEAEFVEQNLYEFLSLRAKGSALMRLKRTQIAQDSNLDAEHQTLLRSLEAAQTIDERRSAILSFLVERKLRRSDGSSRVAK